MKKLAVLFFVCAFLALTSPARACHAVAVATPVVAVATPVVAVATPVVATVVATPVVVNKVVKVKGRSVQKAKVKVRSR